MAFFLDEEAWICWSLIFLVRGFLFGLLLNYYITLSALPSSWRAAEE
jgi:hypothetical protein